MDEKTNNTNAIFMDVISKKVEGLENRINSMDEKIKNSNDNTKYLEKLEKAMQDLHTYVKSNTNPVNELHNISFKLETLLTQKGRQVTNKIFHHHKIPKLTLLTAGLFIFSALACCDWYITANKLTRYEGSDLKYRYLKQKCTLQLLQWFNQIDSLQASEFAMKDSVAKWEAEEQRAFYLFQQFQKTNGEGKSLKKEIDYLEKQIENRKRNN